MPIKATFYCVPFSRFGEMRFIWNFAKSTAPPPSRVAHPFLAEAQHRVRTCWWIVAAKVFHVVCTTGKSLNNPLTLRLLPNRMGRGMTRNEGGGSREVSGGPMEIQSLYNCRGERKYGGVEWRARGRQINYNRERLYSAGCLLVMSFHGRVINIRERGIDGRKTR